MNYNNNEGRKLLSNKGEKTSTPWLRTHETMSACLGRHGHDGWFNGKCMFSLQLTSCLYLTSEKNGHKLFPREMLNTRRKTMSPPLRNTWRVVKEYSFEANSSTNSRMQWPPKWHFPEDSSAIY